MSAKMNESKQIKRVYQKYMFNKFNAIFKKDEL